MESGGPLACRQKSAACPCPETAYSSPRSLILLL